jgi:hypothetical protein
MGLLCFALFIPAAARAKGETPLIKAGRSDYVISLAANASPAERRGATELQQTLQKMSGARLEIVDGSAPRHAIVVRTDPKLAEEEYRIRTRGENVLITGGGRRGAMYGCTALLEDVLGCRWFNSRVSRIPSRADVTLPALDIHETPAFEYREPYYTEALNRDWAARNKVNGNFEDLDASTGGRLKYGRFVHTFAELVPSDKYFATHPEYFSMVNGQRQSGYHQLCLTNPDVLKIAVAGVEKWIQENPDATIFSVSQNDSNGDYCQCPVCSAVTKEEGAPSGLLLRFVNEVADEVGKKYPNVLIDTLAYQWSEKPPLHVRPHKNVRVRIAPIYACFAHPLDACDANKAPMANLSAWSRITDNRLYVWHYSTNFANYMQPLPDLDEIAEDIPLFKQNGVVGVFYEGDYAPGGGGEMSELKAYLMAKLLWDPSRPAKPIIADYLNGVYGAAAPYIQLWLDVLHAPIRANNGMEAHIYDPPTAPYLSDDTLKMGTILFDEAERAAASDAVALDEVQRARLALEYVQLMRAAPDSPERAALAKTVAAKVRKYGIGQAREGQDIAVFLKSIGQESAS